VLVPVLGIGVNAPKEVQEEKVYDPACRTAEFLDTRAPLPIRSPLKHKEATGK